MRRPNMHALIETAARQELPVGAECHGVHGLRVFCQRVDARAAFHVPESYGRVEAGRGQDEVHVGVLGAGARGRPLDCVDFFGVRLEVVHARVLFY